MVLAAPLQIISISTDKYTASESIILGNIPFSHNSIKIFGILPKAPCSCPRTFVPYIYLNLCLCKSDVWLTVHRNSAWIRNQLDVTCVILYFSFTSCSTWLPETRWATCKREIKDNTNVISSWFLIHTVSPYLYKCVIPVSITFISYLYEYK
jgi:hypothetical protein